MPWAVGKPYCDLTNLVFEISVEWLNPSIVRQNEYPNEAKLSSIDYHHCPLHWPLRYVIAEYKQAIALAPELAITQANLREAERLLKSRSNP